MPLKHVMTLFLESWIVTLGTIYAKKCTIVCCYNITEF